MGKEDFIQGYCNRRERPDLILSSAHLKQGSGVRFLRASVIGSCRLSMFANWFYSKEK